MTTEGMKRKEAPQQPFADIINSIIAQAAKTRQGFTPEVIKGFEREGENAAKFRDEQKQLKMTPTKEVTAQLGTIVARKSQMQTEINPLMTKKAIEDAVDLGERVELASQNDSNFKRFRVKDWVLG